MSPVHHEAAFGEVIASAMLADGWRLGSNADYRPDLALDTAQLFEFIGDTQIDEWNELLTYYGGDADAAQAAWRMEQMLKTGQDPGARAGTATPDTTSGEDVDPTDHAATDIDVVQVAADRIQIAIGERFAGHRLANLVAAALTAEGYVCDTSPPGPDGGLDIVAGRGPLGLDQPTVAVQVKSQAAPVGIEVVNQLLGACAAIQATQALLVAWGSKSPDECARDVEGGLRATASATLHATAAPP
jgi:hypothetical protein